MNELSILVLPGDGIGPEVTDAAVNILKQAAEIGDLRLKINYAHAGGISIDKCGEPISEETLKKAKAADAVLLGAVGGEKWDNLPAEKRPEKGLLKLRAELGVYINLRPAKIFEPLKELAPLKEERSRGIDLVVVRELTGGIYFGNPRGIKEENGLKSGVNSMVYNEDEIKRIGKAAFSLASSRRKNLVSVDKANVLEVGALWRKVITDLSKEYPDVTLTHQYVDNCAMQMVINPAQFDVIVTGNMFGDILSDEAAAITGSIGLLPSASIGGGNGLYEPVHGSAPDIAGTGKANPVAAILSVAMLLEHSAKRKDLAEMIENSVEKILEQGILSADLLFDKNLNKNKIYSTEEITAAISENLKK